MTKDVSVESKIINNKNTIIKLKMYKIMIIACNRKIIFKTLIVMRFFFHNICIQYGLISK
jgi:hypothetical protein